MDNTLALLLAKKGGGTGGSADWNASEGEAGHVKNRTHWVEEVILFDGEVTTSEMYGMFGNNTAISIPLSVGEHYTVVFNGVTYECEARALADFGGMSYIGDAYFITGVGDAPQIPFAYADGIFAAGSAGTFTVTIKGKQYHTLNSGYLPTATETSKGAVQFGLGETKAARMVSIYFDATKDEFEHALELHKNYGVVMCIVGDIVSCVSGSLDTDEGVWCKLLRSEPSIVKATFDENGNFTMEREYDVNNVVRSPSGKIFEISVSDDGTLTATALT
jgi:hypothetical protein